MKVIINIKNNYSQYKKYNFLTFEVKELLNDHVGVLLNRENGDFNQTDFHFSEIIIVDFEKELNKSIGLEKERLLNYGKINSIFGYINL